MEAIGRLIKTKLEMGERLEGMSNGAVLSGERALLDARLGQNTGSLDLSHRESAGGAMYVPETVHVLCNREGGPRQVSHTGFKGVAVEDSMRNVNPECFTMASGATP